MKQTDLILLRGLLPSQEEVYRKENSVHKSAYAVYHYEAQREKPKHKQYDGDFCRQNTGEQEREYPATNDKVAAEVPRSQASKVAPRGASGARLNFRTHRFGLQPLAFERAQLSQQSILKAFLGHLMRAPVDTIVPKDVASPLRNFNRYASSGTANFNHA